MLPKTIVAAKIEAIQRELEALKSIVLAPEAAEQKLPERLGGCLQGLEVSEEEIRQAQRELFRDAAADR